MIDEARASVSIRPLNEDDLGEADRIFRLAFGTFLGLPDPLMFLGDGDYVRTRWQADPASAFAAEADGELVGSNFATNWGSVGFFGPASVRPDLWDRGVGVGLVEPAMESVVERHMMGGDEPTQWSRFSGLSEDDREETLKACGELTGPSTTASTYRARSAR